jgi:hypothetical protein
MNLSSSQIYSFLNFTFVGLTKQQDYDSNDGRKRWIN